MSFHGQLEEPASRQIWRRWKYETSFVTVRFDEINGSDLKPSQPRDIKFPKRTFMEKI